MSLVDLGKRLLEAAKQGHTDEVRALMSNGAPFTTDWLGTSPLHFAAMSGHAETAEVLLRAGISRDARTKVDRTPLHVAAQEGHLDIVDLLIRNGADIEAKDMLKMTPLHWAVEKGHFDVIEVLIRQGADVSCENKFDKTPVEIAITNGRPDIAEVLQLHKQTVVEVSTDQQIVEEVTATETISSEVVAAEHNLLAAEGVEATPVTLMRGKQVVEVMGDGEVVTTGEERTEQSSTAVLATLAALAEATGPLNAATSTTSTTVAEAMTNWFETQGITMISNSDNSTIVTSTLESGQKLTLTEAGKLALNFVKQQSSEDGATHAVVEDAGGDGDHEADQKVITLVTDQGELATTTASAPVVVTLGQNTIAADAIVDEPVHKRIKLEEDIETSVASDAISTETITMTIAPEVTTVEEELVEGDVEEEGASEELRRQLEEVQKQAEVYKCQLVQKEQEAEEYKKQLTEISEKS